MCIGGIIHLDKNHAKDIGKKRFKKFKNFCAKTCDDSCDDDEAY